MDRAERLASNESSGPNRQMTEARITATERSGSITARCPARLLNRDLERLEQPAGKMGSARGHSIVSIWKQRGSPSRRAVSSAAGTARDSRGSPSHDQPGDHRPRCHVCRLSFDDRHRCSRRGASQHAIGKIAISSRAAAASPSITTFNHSSRRGFLDEARAVSLSIWIALAPIG